MKLWYGSPPPFLRRGCTGESKTKNYVTSPLDKPLHRARACPARVWRMDKSCTDSAPRPKEGSKLGMVRGPRTHIDHQNNRAVGKVTEDYDSWDYEPLCNYSLHKHHPQHDIHSNIKITPQWVWDRN
jgi:hypothetical protein